MWFSHLSIVSMAGNQILNILASECISYPRHSSLGLPNLANNFLFKLKKKQRPSAKFELQIKNTCFYYSISHETFEMYFCYTCCLISLKLMIDIEPCCQRNLGLNFQDLFHPDKPILGNSWCAGTSILVRQHSWKSGWKVPGLESSIKSIRNLKEQNASFQSEPWQSKYLDYKSLSSSPCSLLKYHLSQEADVAWSQKT